MPLLGVEHSSTPSSPICTTIPPRTLFHIAELPALRRRRSPSPCAPALRFPPHCSIPASPLPLLYGTIGVPMRTNLSPIIASTSPASRRPSSPKTCRFGAISACSWTVRSLPSEPPYLSGPPDPFVGLAPVVVNRLLDLITPYLDQVEYTLALGGSELVGWPLVHLCRTQHWHHLVRVRREHTYRRQAASQPTTHFDWRDNCALLSKIYRRKRYSLLINLQHCLPQSCQAYPPWQKIVL